MFKKAKKFIQDHETSCVVVGGVALMAASVTVSSYLMSRLATQQYYAGLIDASDLVKITLEGKNRPDITL